VTPRLREYQAKLKAETYQAWDAGNRVVVMQLATGGGKTLLLASIVSEHDGYVAVIAHRGELLAQLSCALAQYGVAHDLICSDSTRREITALHVMKFGQCLVIPGHRVRVVAVDTMVRRDVKQWAGQVTLWVVDEHHHLVTGEPLKCGSIDTAKANKWGKAVAQFTHPVCRGLGPTATPQRSDGRGLARVNSNGTPGDGLADIMLQGPSPRWLIENGYLTDYRVVCPTSDMSVLADVAASGDWSPKVLKEASQRSHIVGDVVTSYLTHAPNRLGATFTTDVETATQMAQAYRDAGVPAEVLTGETDDRLRANILKRLERREILQICVVDIISEGFDLPALEVISMARPTQSLSLYLQVFGRVLRPMYAPGFTLDTVAGRFAAMDASAKGRKALLIDHVGNFLRHRGGPDAPREWSLDRRDKRASGPSDAMPLRVCLDHTDAEGRVTAIGCLQPYPAHLSECEHCGLERPPPASRGSPAAVEGVLSELSPEVLAAIRAQLPEDEATMRERLMAARLPDIPLRANLNRLGERRAALDELRAAMGRFGGPYRAAGRSDVEIQRAFWHIFDISVGEAAGLDRAKALALAERIDSQLTVPSICAI